MNYSPNTQCIYVGECGWKKIFHYSNHFSVKQENFLQPKEYPIAPLPKARIWPLLLHQHHLLALHRAFLLKLLNIVILSLNLSVFLQILKTTFATELVQSTCFFFLMTHLFTSKCYAGKESILAANLAHLWISAPSSILLIGVVVWTHSYIIYEKL